MQEEILNQLISELHATGDDHIEIAKHCGISPRAFGNFIRGKLKNGGSLKTVASIAGYVGYELKLVKRP